MKLRRYNKKEISKKMHNVGLPNVGKFVSLECAKKIIESFYNGIDCTFKYEICHTQDFMLYCYIKTDELIRFPLPYNIDIFGKPYVSDDVLYTISKSLKINTSIMPKSWDEIKKELDNVFSEEKGEGTFKNYTSFSIY